MYWENKKKLTQAEYFQQFDIQELSAFIFKVLVLETYTYHFFPLVYIQTLKLYLLWTEFFVPEKE
jgi:hypothetical protein